MTMRPFRVLLLVGICALMAACTTTQSTRPVERNPQGFAAWTDQPPAYLLGPGDRVKVQFLLTPELGEETTVEPDGTIALRSAGRVKAEGLTAAQLEQSIATASKRLLLSPMVTVSVSDPAAALIYVGGSVRRPGAYPVTGRRGIIEAIALANGLEPEAREDEVVLIRRNPENRPMLRTVDVQAFVSTAVAAGRRAPLCRRHRVRAAQPDFRGGPLGGSVHQQADPIQPFVRIFDQPQHAGAPAMTGLALAAETSRPAKFSAADVAVIIVTYNRVVELRRCLASLQRQHPGIGQVTVFDNASSDGTDEMVRTEHPWVRLVTSPENLGACVARNEAARGSTEALIWFLDSDTEVVELDGGGRMAALFDGSDVAAVGGEAVVTARGRVIGVKRLRLTPNALVQGDLILANAPEVSHCEVIASCNLMVRRSDFEAASGFDPFYFFFYEDMDLTWRLSNKGRTLLSLSSMPVIHRYSDSARIRRIWPESRNRTYFIIKNFGWARLLILPALDVAQMIRTDRHPAAAAPGREILRCDEPGDRARRLERPSQGAPYSVQPG